jgi:DNA mismatch repair protein MutL
MGKIRILDEHIANQIAAGEVVERPSSVVKELVENAIDAGATRIDVSASEGGLQLIRVMDNGSGMEPDDCEAAFQRHATSKITDGRDLFRIRTLGFRGEALPSIAAVAKVECVTSAEDGGLGRKVVIEGGALLGVEETAASRGTDISVRELFYNTPARLKYMKTIQTELGHISDYMYRLAFAYPSIAFSLKHNGNLLLKTLGNGDLLQVIAAVYGTSTAKGMLPVHAENPDFAVRGYISRPELTRANRGAMTTLVNGRYIRSFSIIQGLLSAYHTLLPVHRFPLAVLGVEMDPSLVDVNVHPAKLEARFSKEAELVRFVEESARGVLRRQVLIPRMSRPAPKPPVVQEQMRFYSASPATGEGASAPLPKVQPAAAETAAGSAAPKPAAPAGLKPPAAGFRPAAASPEAARPVSGETAERGVPASGAGGSRPRQAGRPADASGQMHGREPAAPDGLAVRPPAAASPAGPAVRPPSAPEARFAAAPAVARPTAPGGSRGGWTAAAGGAENGEAEGPPAFPMLSPIGQMHGTYILAQNEKGLYLIDQHAAHERINYEYYYEKFGNPAEASQQLLVPITLEFTTADAARIAQSLPLFAAAGVYLEPFGGQTFIVRAHPHWFPAGEEKDIIEEMAEWILSERKAVDLARLREKAAALCSCKASIKANQNLSPAEIEELLIRLARCRNPYTCPHGRPIVVSISTYELEKMFKRVM